MKFDGPPPEYLAAMFRSARGHNRPPDLPIDYELHKAVGCPCSKTPDEFPAKEEKVGLA